MSDPAMPREIIRFQLAVLDAYQRMLGRCAWDEAALNQALKSMMASMLPFLRAQRAVGEQLFAAHKEMLEQYRKSLEAALKGIGDTPDRRGNAPP